MFDEYHDQLRREALETYPREAVWLITPGECRQVRNVADDPEATFRVDKRSLTSAHQRGLLAVVHSHPDHPECPSESDMKGQIASGVPWGIVATDGEACGEPFFWGYGVEPPPLIGRPFRHGVTDCYALIRDYYHLEMGVNLPEFPRKWQWHLHGDDLYTQGYAQAGFRKLGPDENPRPGDMFFAQIRSDVPNHGGILLDKSLILHHVCSRKPYDTARLSKREPIGRWGSLITSWYRHEQAE